MIKFITGSGDGCGRVFLHDIQYFEVMVFLRLVVQMGNAEYFVGCQNGFALDVNGNVDEVIYKNRSK